MLRSLSKNIHQLNEQIGRATSWLTAVLVAIVFVDVVAQKGFDYSAAWMLELEWHVFSLIFLLGAGYALRHNRHVRVDLFFENFSKQDKALVNFWGTLVFFLPWCLFVIWHATSYAIESWHDQEGSPQPNGLPAWYPIKFAIVVGVMLLLLQGVAAMIDAWVVLVDEKRKNRQNGD